MDARSRFRRRHLAAVVGTLSCGALVAALCWPQPPLTPLESRCVGAWTYPSPEKSSTAIVYRFGRDRNVREEHYYLTSATPTVPRIQMVGRWRVEPDGRMVVEPRGGLGGLGDAGSGFLRDLLGDDRRLTRPVLRRFYQVDSATPHGLSARTGEVRIVMRPFRGAQDLSSPP